MKTSGLLLLFVPAVQTVQSLFNSTARSKRSSRSIASLGSNRAEGYHKNRGASAAWSIQV
jgi:hypothetical protein